MTQLCLRYLSAMKTLMKFQTLLPHCNENPECATSLSWQPWLLSHCHYENLTHHAVSLPWQNPWLTMLSHCPDKTLTNCVISRSWQNHIHHYKTLNNCCCFTAKTKTLTHYAISLLLQNPHCTVSPPRQKSWLTVLSHHPDKNPDSLCYLTVMAKPLIHCAISLSCQKHWFTVLSHCHDKTISITTKPWLTVLSHCQDKTTDSLWYLTVMIKPYLSVQNPD